MATRYQVAKLLRFHCLPSEIASKTDASPMLIAKIRAILEEEGNGFDMALEAEQKVSYTSFAGLYDSLTKDVGYEKRCDYIEGLFERFSTQRPSLVLDLACGTGNFTQIFSARGYEMIGIDASAEMLAVAKEKNQKGNILYLNQPMDEFELYGTVDAVLCLLDSINYLEDSAQLTHCFRLVNNYLNPDGLFIFDINTEYKLSKVLPGNTYTGKADGIYYIWENFYDKDEKVCEFALNFFARQKGGLYEHSEELHYETAFSHETIEAALHQAGLELLACYDDLSFSAPRPRSQKVFYIAKKPSLQNGDLQ